MSYHDGYQPKQTEGTNPPPGSRVEGQRKPSRLSGHDVYDAMLKIPGDMGMGIGDCHVVAQILNRKLGLL